MDIQSHIQRVFKFRCIGTVCCNMNGHIITIHHNLHLFLTLYGDELSQLKLGRKLSLFWSTPLTLEKDLKNEHKSKRFDSPLTDVFQEICLSVFFVS